MMTIKQIEQWWADLPSSVNQDAAELRSAVQSRLDHHGLTAMEFAERALLLLLQIAHLDEETTLDAPIGTLHGPTPSVRERAMYAACVIFTDATPTPPSTGGEA